MLLHLEVAEKIVYLMILIVILIYALLRKRKTNSSRGGQRPVSFNVTGDDGDTSSGEISIAVTQTSLGLNMTAALS